MVLAVAASEEAAPAEAGRKRNKVPGKGRFKVPGSRFQVQGSRFKVPGFGLVFNAITQ